MSAPGNTTKLGPAQQHTDSTKLFVPDWDRTYNALVSTLLSQRISLPCQPDFSLVCKVALVFE